MSAAVIAVAAEQYSLTIVTKHGKSIKTIVTGDLFNVTAVRIHDVHMKRKTSFVFMITAKNYSAIRQKVWRPVSLSKIG